MKAVLVVEMPNNCYDCQYCRFDARRYNFRGCVLTDTEVQDGTIDICKEIHSCCPLKPMPQKNKYDVEKYATVDYENNVTLGHYLNHGRNACIDEILGDDYE